MPSYFLVLTMVNVIMELLDKENKELTWRLGHGLTK